MDHMQTEAITRFPRVRSKKLTTPPGQICKNSRLSKNNMLSFLLVAFVLGTPILLTSFSVINQQLDVSCAVQNIAYTKVVLVKYCTVGKDCSRSISCYYSNGINSTFENWKCSGQNFYNGLVSFTLSYSVSGKTFEDLGPSGSGYQASISPAKPTETTTSKVVVTSTTLATQAQPAPSALPGCQNYNGLDSCSGNHLS